jgi:HSP20 family protein
MDDMDEQYGPDPLSSFFGMMSRMQGVSHQFMPALDMAVVADSLIVRLDVPGLCGEDIEVGARPGLLTIQGERKDDLADVQRIHHERPHSAFRRQVRLPEGAMTDDIMASCKNGVLTVTIPFAQPEEPKRIEVQDLDS